MIVYIIVEQGTDRFIGIRNNLHDAQKLMNSGNSLNMILRRRISK